MRFLHTKLLPLLACLSLGSCLGNRAAGRMPDELPAAVETPDSTPGSALLQGAEAEQPAEWQRLEVPEGDFVMAWRALGAGLQRNEYLELEVEFQRQGLPLQDVQLEVLGWMPAHGHGFLRLTAVEQRGPGSFLVKGVLFHMRGHWQLTFDVSHAGAVYKLPFELDIQ